VVQEYSPPARLRLWRLGAAGTERAALIYQHSDDGRQQEAAAGLDATVRKARQEAAAVPELGKRRLMRSRIASDLGIRTLAWCPGSRRPTSHRAPGTSAGRKGAGLLGVDTAEAVQRADIGKRVCEEVPVFRVREGREVCLARMRLLTSSATS
jgi:hypothetical protein